MDIPASQNTIAHELLSRVKRVGGGTEVIDPTLLRN